jgi:hypothetical protein
MRDRIESSRYKAAPGCPLPPSAASPSRVTHRDGVTRCDNRTMPTPLRLPLSPRQAEALAALLDLTTAPFVDGLTYEQLAAVREVAEKLATLRETR